MKTNEALKIIENIINFLELNNYKKQAKELYEAKETLRKEIESADRIIAHYQSEFSDLI